MEDTNNSPSFEEFLKRNKKFDGLKAQRIGSGTYGSVYKCFNKAKEKDVVYKVMRSECRKQGLIENDMLRKLRSMKYVVSLYNAYRWKGHIVLEMELLIPIRDIFSVDNPKFKSTTQLWKYFQQMLVGLNEIHKMGIVHRDVSIDNIMYDQNEDVIKYIDFGFSIQLDKDFILMNNPEAYKIAAPFFRAPELFGTEYISYDMTIDEWSLGCVFYWICTGLNIFEDIPMNVTKKRRMSNSQRRKSTYQPLSSVEIKLNEDEEKQIEDEEFRQKVLSYTDKRDYYSHVWNIFENSHRYSVVDKFEFSRLSNIIKSLMEPEIGKRQTTSQCIEKLKQYPLTTDTIQIDNDAKNLKVIISECRQKICDNVFEFMIRDLITIHRLKRISSVEKLGHIMYELKLKYRDGCKKCSKKLPSSWKPKRSDCEVLPCESEDFSILSTWYEFQKTSIYDNHLDHFVYMALEEFYVQLP